MEEAGFLFTDFYFNSLPHAEVDSDAIKPEIENRKFQLTTSRRGRRDDIVITGINIIFQLTTSRRGRQGLISEPCKSVYFNSLPHAEVDCSEYGSGRPENISTHYLTQR